MVPMASFCNGGRTTWPARPGQQAHFLRHALQQGIKVFGDVQADLSQAREVVLMR